MASVIKAGNATDGIAISSDNTGILELKTGTGAGTTAVTIGTDQSVTFAGAISSSGNQTVTGNLTVTGSGSIQGLTVGRGAGSVATNTAVGASALAATTGSSSNNTAVGSAAGSSLTSGARNTALGFNALLLNTTGTENTAVGGNALNKSTTASNNTAVGYVALFENTTGAYNTAVGLSALQNNTTANYNNAFGGSALAANTTGTENNAFGYWALLNNTTGNSNVAFGEEALRFNTTGGSNTAVGGYSLYSATTGNANTAMGINAGRELTTGSNNTIIGDSAGRNYTGGGGVALTTGSNNVFVGLGTTPTSAAAENQITIGAGLLGLGNNYFTFGKGNGADRVYNLFTSNATWTRSSDQRLKKDIQTNTELGLGFINDVRTVSYKWKAPSEIEQGVTGHDPDVNEPSYANKMYGFIAQEVKSALDKHGVTDFSGWHVTPEEQGAIQGVSYEMFVVPLVNAVKELSAQVTALQTELNALKGQA